MGNYSSMEVTGTVHRSTKFDELTVNRFKVNGPSPGSLGRCFVEVRLQNDHTYSFLGNKVLQDVILTSVLKIGLYNA